MLGLCGISIPIPKQNVLQPLLIQLNILCKSWSHFEIPSYGYIVVVAKGHVCSSRRYDYQFANDHQVKP
jgi:hypothetical protein